MPYSDPEKAKARNRAYYLKNREHWLARSSEYLKNHAEEIKACKRRWHEKNRPKCRVLNGEWAKNNRHKVTPRIRKWRSENPDKCRVYNRRYKLANREKTRAHYALRNAIISGKIKRNPCIFCGNPNSHGHHSDYSKPLEVIWVCVLHHMRIYHQEAHEKLQHATG